jgi:hypothetical protein
MSRYRREGLVRPGSFGFSKAATVCAAGLFVAAALLYPGGTLADPTARGYSWAGNSISDLGAATAWNGQPNTASAALAIAGAILLAIAGVWSLVALVRVYAASPQARVFAYAAAGAGLLACAAFAGAMATPQDLSLGAHMVFSTMASWSMVAASVLFAIATLRDRRFAARAAAAWLVLAVAMTAWIVAVMTRPWSGTAIVPTVVLQKIVAVVMLGVLFLECREAERATRHRLAGGGVEDFA